MFASFHTIELRTLVVDAKMHVYEFGDVLYIFRQTDHFYSASDFIDSSVKALKVITCQRSRMKTWY